MNPFLPALMTRAVHWWVRFYTMALSPDLSDDRWMEIRSDLWKQTQEATRLGLQPGQVAWLMLRRLVAGVPADLAWRIEAGGLTPVTRGLSLGKGSEGGNGPLVTNTAIIRRWFLLRGLLGGTVLFLALAIVGLLLMGGSDDGRAVLLPAEEAGGEIAAAGDAMTQIRGTQFVTYSLRAHNASQSGWDFIATDISDAPQSNPESPTQNGDTTLDRLKDKKDKVDTLLVPTYVPRDFTLSKGLSSGRLTMLIYTTNGSSLMITQRAISPGGKAGPPGSHPVSVGQYEGYMMDGGQVVSQYRVNESWVDPLISSLAPRSVSFVTAISKRPHVLYFERDGVSPHLTASPTASSYGFVYGVSAAVAQFYGPSRTVGGGRVSTPPQPGFLVGNSGLRTRVGISEAQLLKIAESLEPY